jgi:hydrogenase nickel incorporation protein HypA/HybF
MHEWALAESIIATAINAAKKEKIKKITEINIEIGELQQIKKEVFNFVLDEIVKLYKDNFKDVSINIKIDKTRLQCKHCNHEFTFKDIKNDLNDDTFEAIHFIPEVAFVHTRCPKCHSPDFDILKGRGVALKSIKGEVK